MDPRESTVERVTPAEFQKLVTRASGASQPRAVRLARQTEGQQNYWRYGLMLMLGDARGGGIRWIAIDLTQSLQTVRRRWRTLLALRAAARALIAAALIAAAAALAERWLQPSDGAVLVLAALAVALALAALGVPRVAAAAGVPTIARSRGSSRNGAPSWTTRW